MSKIRNSKKLSLQKFNILNNKLKKVLKAEKKDFLFYLNIKLYKYTYIH